METQEARSGEDGFHENPPKRAGVEMLPKMCIRDRPMPGLESDRREGDSVEARTPKGIGRIEILKISH